MKSPAACQTYSTTSDLLPAATPASKRPASTRSVSQNGIPSERDGAERPDRLAQPVAARRHDERRLRCEHERPVGMRRDGGEDRQRPEHPAAPAAAFQRAQQREIRERGGEEEEAVHPAVDAVEEERPAGRDEERRDQRGDTAAEPRQQQRDDAGGSRRRRAPTPPVVLRARARGAPPSTRAGSGAVRRRAPRARPGTSDRADGGR